MGIQVELVLMVSLETPMDHGLGASPSLQKMKVIAAFEKRSYRP